MTEAADHRLVEAVRASDQDAVRQALADGANPNASMGRFRGTALAEAARTGHAAIVELLAGAGAAMAPGDLRSAVIESRPEVARLLIDRGALAADPGALLTEAVSYTRFKPGPAALATLRVLLEAGLPTEQALIAAVMKPSAPAVLRLLLEFGADPGGRRSDGVPAIVLAARRGDHAAVDVLLEAGADVDARDPDGRTALMHAVERDEKRVIATLLTAGADRDLAAPDGTTALLLARGAQNQNIEHMLGQRQTTMADVPITRTTARIRPSTVRLTGDPGLFRLLADTIDVALDDLGDDEWEIRRGLSAETARAVVVKLRDDFVRADGASWHQLPLTADELDAIRSALVELAYGTTRTLPPGATRLQLTDLLEELRW